MKLYTNTYSLRLLPLSLLATLAVIVVIGLVSTGCRRTPDTTLRTLDHIQEIIEKHPDSALSLIKSIDTMTLRGATDRARYSLLRTMALDKNNIPITDQELIRPALDYYLKYGTPDQRMRARYYEGIINLKNGDNDKAFTCFLDAVHDSTKVYTDSLGLALVYIAQGAMYVRQYNAEAFIDANLKAIRIYESVDPDNHNLIPSYLRILNGANIISDTRLADSIYNICESRLTPDDSIYDQLVCMRLVNLIGSEDRGRLRQYLVSLERDSIQSELCSFDMAYAYNTIGRTDKALHYIDLMEDPRSLDAEKYLLIKSDVLDSAGRYQESKRVYQEYLDSFHSSQYRLLRSDLLVTEKKYSMELEIAKTRAEKSRQVAILLGILLICVIFIFALIYYRYKERTRRYMERNRRIIAQQQNEIAEARLETELLEKDKLKSQIRDLQLEIDTFEQHLNDSEIISTEALDIIYQRLEILNRFITYEVRKMDYDKRSWKELDALIHSDRAAFIRSTRKAYTARHPQVISYLEEQGFDSLELDISCLYALGLRVSDVDTVMKSKIATEKSRVMRKKLKLASSDTNINIYIRNLFYPVKK
ncbi:MAG: hypothetical protein K2H35_04630 [Muribaculaceae bacterium]|nr:hypothetical protein [Muribaculaceae bacterium]